MFEMNLKLVSFIKICVGTYNIWIILFWCLFEFGTVSYNHNINSHCLFWCNTSTLGAGLEWTTIATPGFLELSLTSQKWTFLLKETFIFPIEWNLCDVFVTCRLWVANLFNSFQRLSRGLVRFSYLGWGGGHMKSH